MPGVHLSPRGERRRLLRRTVLLASLAVVAATAVPANAAQPAVPHYVIKATTGAPYVAGYTNLFPTDSGSLVRLSTTSSGAARMPFPVKVYGVTRTSMWVSVYGNVQFTNHPSDAWMAFCLPTGAFVGPTLAVYWDDLSVASFLGQGVFTRTIGTAPHRQFVISWRASSPSAYEVRAEVVFTEGSTAFSYVYASGDGRDATIGIQKAGWVGSPATQWACDSGGQSTFAGLKLTFTPLP